MRHLFVVLVHVLAIIGSIQVFALDGRLTVTGPELLLDLGKGQILRRHDLIGFKLALPGSNKGSYVEIEGVDEDTGAVGRPLPLYRLSVHDTAGKTKFDFCTPDRFGRSAGLAFPDDHGGWSFTCTSGAEGKCILMGYRPWDTRDDVSMRDLHAACVHLLRADYGGDNHPTTENGTLIDIYDRFGIQTSETSAAMAFEAAWGADGAVCVAHPRIARNISLDKLAKRYPSLAGALGTTACTEATMAPHPHALIFNRSPETLP